jgi:tetrahydromethanopterin S-methyltransferase subunit G
MQNKERFDGIDRRMDRMQTELTQRIDKVQSDLNMFHREMGRHDNRLDALEANAK